MALNVCGKYKYKKKGLPRQMTEHRLVMLEVDPRDNADELVIHHIDGNKSNNSSSNLEWMTRSEHSRLHHMGDNHFPCGGVNNANYRHGMCVGGANKEYKHIHNQRSYQKHREERLAKQNAYGVDHREQKRLYDKIRYWERELQKAVSESRRKICMNRLVELQEG